MGYFQKHVVTLEQSTKDATEQIDAAFQLLQLNSEDGAYSVASKSGKNENSAISPTGPAAEWTMRWLLKRLNGEQITPGSFCLNHRTWQLLSVLCKELPTSKTGSLLKLHNAVHVFTNTLLWLRDQVKAENHIIFFSDVFKQRRATSMTAMKDKNKKRKRGGDDISLEYVGRIDVTTLYTSLCGTLQTLLARTTYNSGRNAFHAEYMKSVLRQGPETAAKALGCSLDILAEILAKSSYELPDIDADIQNSLLAPFVSFWELCKPKNEVGSTSLDMVFFPCSHV